jgi:hypothetical protein
MSPPGTSRIIAERPITVRRDGRYAASAMVGAGEHVSRPERGAYACCGVRIDGYGPDAAVLALLDSQYGVARGVHLCNSYTLALAYRNDAYRRVLNAGDMNLADGHYVAMVGRWRGQADLTERVYGPTLMLSTMDRGREVGLRHYLYGTTEETLNRLSAKLSELYPGIDIVGVEAPPFRRLTADEEDELAARIEAAKPDILWVGRRHAPAGRLRRRVHRADGLHGGAGRGGVRLQLGHQAVGAAVGAAHGHRVAVPPCPGAAAAVAPLPHRHPGLHVRGGDRPVAAEAEARRAPGRVAGDPTQRRPADLPLDDDLPPSAFAGDNS